MQVINDCQPTKSTAKIRQKWGRGLRYDEDVHFIFDHGNNIANHGMPCADREWKLEGEEKGARKEKDITARQCPECYRCHHPAPHCPECGFVYPVDSREIEEIEGELKEIQEAQEKKSKRMEVGRAKTYEDLLRIAEERGYNRGWVYHTAKNKGILR